MISKTDIDSLTCAMIRLPPPDQNGGGEEPVVKWRKWRRAPALVCIGVGRDGETPAQRNRSNRRRPNTLKTPSCCGALIAVHIRMTRRSLRPSTGPLCKHMPACESRRPTTTPMPLRAACTHAIPFEAQVCYHNCWMLPLPLCDTSINAQGAQHLWIGVGQVIRLVDAALHAGIVLLPVPCRMHGARLGVDLVFVTQRHAVQLQVVVRPSLASARSRPPPARGGCESSLEALRRLALLALPRHLRLAQLLHMVASHQWHESTTTP